jgi:DNA-binding transcriptional regulator YiaG
MNAGGRFMTSDENGVVCSTMNGLRELRRSAGLGQREFASLLSVPLETLRTWDSGRRPIPVAVLPSRSSDRAAQTSERAAGERFLATHYRRFSGQRRCARPFATVPDDYDGKLRKLRRRLQLTQGVFAQRIGAAGKAVVYQWESRRRMPSPVLWQRVIELERRSSLISCL